MLNEKIPPMLAYSSEPFDSKRHIFEIKWDGTRCILFLKEGKIYLQNRRLMDITDRYPELKQIVKCIKAKNAILDGEIVILRDGKPDFNLLQQREHATNSIKITLLSRDLPATYIAFDLLFLNGKSYVEMPLIKRKELLKQILEESEYLVESRYIEEKGITFFKKVLEQGLEGIMAKAKDSPYIIGKRSRYWLKIKPKHSAICYIVGYTEGKGERKGLIGALVLATQEEGKWKYRGKVGTGFTEEELSLLLTLLKKIETKKGVVKSPFKNVHWVEPILKCEVIFQEITKKGCFRSPVFLKLIKNAFSF